MTAINTQCDKDLLKDIQALIEIYAKRGRVYIDEKTWRCHEFSSNRVIPKAMIQFYFSEEERLLFHITSKMRCGDTLDVAFSDYSPELLLGRMNNSARWFYEIGAGVRPYERRSASDSTVIEHGNDLVTALLAVYQIDCGIEAGKISQRLPLAWHKNNAILSAYSKTAPVMDKLARTSVHNGMFLLLKAREDGRPMPSRLEIWLAMNPIELFTTIEGRAERDRQAARFKRGETSL